MSSSFHLSAFQDNSDDSDAAEAEDPEILRIQEQINEAESNLEKIYAQVEEEKVRHEKELKEIAVEIEKAKKIRDDGLAEQQQEQHQEIEQILREYEEEREMFEHSLQKGVEDNRQYAQKSNEIILLSDEAKIANLERKVEIEKAKIQESIMNAESKQLQKTLKKKQVTSAYKQRFLLLEKEISDLQGKRRENSSDVRLRISELATKIQVKQVEHTTIIRKLENDMKARDKDYQTHIDTVKRQLEKEKQTADVETETMAVRYQNLQKYYQSVSKQGSQQLARITHDIEKLKRELDTVTREGFGSNQISAANATKDDAVGRKIAAENKEMLKMQHIQKQVQGERDQVNYIKNELKQTKDQISAAYLHLRDTKKQSQQSSFISTRERKTKNSIF
ncbi:hypothetical protein M9Y10_039475 [Tritrichomonas musculus]|uniref:Uncharacterized protein n=1 Tax=Tritrichomonas musculus TaxID=1915356 RepID=A0ABR2KBB1_9EUKA